MRPLPFAVLASLGLCLLACASTPGVVAIGPDTYMVSRQAATGFSGTGGLMTAAMREAQGFCRSKGKTMQVVNTQQSSPPYILGNFPRAEVQFMCLDASDPELARPKLRREADVIISAPPAEPIIVAPQVTPPLSSPPERVRVAIESAPAAADVYVDGSFVGNTPLPHFSLSPGEHLIEITKQGYSSWSRRIVIVAATPTNIAAELEPIQP